ncbi:hypothetical protein C8R45DRAFT_252380 [Mycena sanguinolenta]|nr:hypothetical protein C8R45DRAFT_252380 [Mycena sanguinolenta]
MQFMACTPLLRTCRHRASCSVSAYLIGRGYCTWHQPSHSGDCYSPVTSPGSSMLLPAALRTAISSYSRNSMRRMRVRSHNRSRIGRRVMRRITRALGIRRVRGRALVGGERLLRCLSGSVLPRNGIWSNRAPPLPAELPPQRCWWGCSSVPCTSGYQRRTPLRMQLRSVHTRPSTRRAVCAESVPSRAAAPPAAPPRSAPWFYPHVPDVCGGCPLANHRAYTQEGAWTHG